MTFTVKIPKSLVRRIRQEAKAAFPNECYAVLLGHWTPPLVEVADIWVPPDVQSGPKHVSLRPEWIVEAKDYAREIGYELVGDMHSHTFTRQDALNGVVYDTSPSANDLKAYRWDRLQMIVLVRETRSGLRTTYDIWGPLNNVVVDEK